MKLKSVLFIPIIIFSLTPVILGKNIHLELKENVTLSEKEILLGDVTYISCDDSELTQRLNNIFIGYTPLPGSVRKVEKNIINSRLLDKGVNLKDVVYGGADSSMVSVESIAIPGDEILQAAKDYLLSTLDLLPKSDVVIETDRPPRDKLLPRGGPLHLEISRVNENKKRGRILVVVRIYVDEKQCQKIPVYFNVRTYENIVVAKKRLKRDDLLTHDNLILKRIETTNSLGATFDEIGPLIGKKMVRSILPHKPITDEIIENPALIKRGDFVKILVQIGNLRVMSKGIAKEDGYVGKVIRVKNVDSQKELYGKVKDHTTVKIIM